MKDYKIANLIEHGVHAVVEFVDVGFSEPDVREELDELHDRSLNQEDARRFERLKKTGRQSNRDAVAIPHLPALAWNEAEQPWFTPRTALQICEQQVGGSLLVDMLRAEYVPVSGSVLQRYLPLPACFVGHCAGIRWQLAQRLRRHGQRAVTEEPLSPIFITGLERLLDQKPAETRTINEKFPANRIAALQQDAGDESILRS